jgi:hypothetical protein
MVIDAYTGWSHQPPAPSLQRAEIEGLPWIAARPRARDLARIARDATLGASAQRLTAIPKKHNPCATPIKD